MSSFNIGFVMYSGSVDLLGRPKLNIMKRKLRNNINDYLSELKYSINYNNLKWCFPGKSSFFFFFYSKEYCCIEPE